MLARCCPKVLERSTPDTESDSWVIALTSASERWVMPLTTRRTFPTR